MKKNKFLLLFVVCVVIFIMSIYMSFKTGKIEYAWIIGSILLGIGSIGEYLKQKSK